MRVRRRYAARGASSIRVSRASTPAETPENKPNGVARAAMRPTYFTSACCEGRSPAADSGFSRHAGERGVQRRRRDEDRLFDLG